MAVSAQAPTGSISGVVSDPTGAVVPGASITVTNNAGVEVSTTSTAVGGYNVTTLLPGEYEVKVEASGMKTTVATVTVQVGRPTTLNVQLELGAATETITVESTGIAVNTQTHSVEGVVTPAEIQNLPLSGRNFLDLGQLEPGVQVQDGGNFDPTKNQFTGLSIAGSTGRTTRITVDGIDISDETVGTTVQNISADAIQEFQISRGTSDISTDLTDTGAVNVVTKGGDNTHHGSAFLFVRTDDGAAKIGGEVAAIDREQWGFTLGGPLQQDKLFYFLSHENNNQDGATFVDIPAFPQFGGTFEVPFDERLDTGRLDWNVAPNTRAFYRFSHNMNDAIAASSLGGVRLEPFSNLNLSNTHAAGVDFTTGNLSNSIRFGYVNFNNGIGDNGGCAFTTAIPEFEGNCVNIRFVGSGGTTRIGHSRLAPQQTLQDNYQYNYNGSYALGDHTLRFGTNVTVIRGNIFAPFFSGAPEVRITVNAASTAAVAAGTVPGQQDLDPTNIANYPIQFAVIGNGLGFFSDVATNGLPFGGAKNTRFHFYAADQWRVNPRLTVHFGARYVFEAGNVNADFDKPALLDTFIPGLSQRTPQDKDNIAPHVGFAYDLTGEGKSVVRAGAGIFFAPNIFNNTLFERAQFIPPGVGFDFAFPGLANVISPLDGSVLWDGTFGGSSISGQAIGTAGLQARMAQAALDFETASNAATATFPSGPTIFELSMTTAGVLFDPSFDTPYSIQTNVGIQHEVRPGLVLSAEYLFSRGLHSILVRDFNRVGAADTLNVANAQAAIAATLLEFDDNPGVLGGNVCTTIDCAIAGGMVGFDPADPNAGTDAGATISDFANFGLGEGQFATSTTPNSEAFAGINPIFNSMQLLSMAGKSEYNALQMSLRGSLPDLGEVIRNHHIVVSYSLSQLEATTLDTAFAGATSVRNDDITGYFGPSQLDRTYMFSTASIFELPGDVRIGSIWRFNSALPQSPVLSGGGGTDEIFFTDFDGDGTTSDPLPGCNRGCFGRSVNGSQLTGLITDFNNNVAGGFTPAGQALIGAGLFTAAQLQALGAVIPAITSAGVTELDNYMTTDVRVTKIFKQEKYSFEVAMEWFNIFNVHNFDLPGNLTSGTLSGLSGSINGVGKGNGAGFGGGSFAQGIPRSWQASMRVIF